MKLIESKIERIDEKDPLKKIELAARTCYKSEAQITDDSAKRMYDGLIKREHYAMLEHVAFTFDVPEQLYYYLQTFPFFNCTYIKDDNNESRYIISGNLRAILESSPTAINEALIEKFPDLISSTKLPAYMYSDAKLTSISNFVVKNPSTLSDLIDKHTYITYRITCDRGVSHELVRHRRFSFAQESTRYVNYAKNADMLFIKPANYDNWDSFVRTEFVQAISDSEIHYKNFIELGCTPQLARAVLPNAIKTEVVMTGNLENWKHFLDLRYYETTGKAHPDMKRIATMIHDDLVAQGFTV